MNNEWQQFTVDCVYNCLPNHCNNIKTTKDCILVWFQVKIEKNYKNIGGFPIEIKTRIP